MDDTEAAAELPIEHVHLPSWVWFGAFFGGAIEALDGRILYGSHLTSTGLALTVAGRTLIGLFAGAAVGALCGAIAIGVEPFRKRRPARRKPRPRLGWLLGLALGIAVGGYNVATSPAKNVHDRVEAACARTDSALQEAGLALDSRLRVKGQGYINAALASVPGCTKPEGDVFRAQAMLLQAIAGYQGESPYLDVANQARNVADHCAKVYAKSNPVVSRRCKELAQSAYQTATQRYCDAALRLSNDADDSIAHLDYDLGLREANEALGRVAKCASPLAYAYRGVALLKRGISDYGGGQKARGSADIATAKQLLGRCLDELDPDSPQKELRKNCALQLSNANAGKGSPG